ncbi:MAG: sugar phosphate isomerase/epimerase, partial [Planctomycetes bacterium]|nr:sugar phosphate isomerase/epimerase [Planctomycetota bacterium]
MFFIGNQTAKHAAPVHAPFAYALRQGFNAFEWFADTGADEAGRTYGFDFAQIDAGGRARLRALAAEGARFSVHAPWDADPRTPNGAAAARAALEFATAIGAAVVVVHLCRELAEITDFAKALNEIMAPHAAVMVAAENTVESSPAHCNAFVAAMAGLPGAGRAGIAFDLGHANCCEATRNDYIRFLRELSPAARILHCHVHENWGDRDAHLPLFTGPAGQNDAGVKLFLEILRERKFSGSLILEQWPEPPESLENAAARLEKTLRHDGAEVAPRRPAMAEGKAAELLAALFPDAAPDAPSAAA